MEVRDEAYNMHQRVSEERMNDKSLWVAIRSKPDRINRLHSIALTCR